MKRLYKGRLGEKNVKVCLKILEFILQATGSK